MRRVLDVLTVALGIAAVAKWLDPEMIMNALWVTVVIGGFLFGLQASILRIGFAAVVAVVQSVVEEGASEPLGIELELTEWPLLVVICVVVALLADRVSATARRYAALYRQASDRLMTAHEEERASLARDLHDGVSQTLTAVMLTLDAAEAALAPGPGRSTAPAEVTIRRAKTLAATALNEAREVATRLRPVRIREIGLGAAVRDLAWSAGIPVDVRFDPAVLPLGMFSPEREIDIYRIVQEALGNAARHGLASSVVVTAEVQAGVLRIEVSDDGAGFDPAAAVGLGLEGMRERATILEGRLEIRSRPGSGTRIMLTVPVDGADSTAGPGSDIMRSAVTP